MGGDEVVQVYLRNLRDPEGPLNPCGLTGESISQPEKETDYH